MQMLNRSDPPVRRRPTTFVGDFPHHFFGFAMRSVIMDRNPEAGFAKLQRHRAADPLGGTGYQDILCFSLHGPNVCVRGGCGKVKVRVF